MGVDATPLGLCAALAVRSTQMASLLTIPYITRIFEERFDDGLWGNWFRLLTFILCFLAAVVAGLGFYLRSRQISVVAVVGLVLSSLCVSYNVLFGIRVPQLSLCSNTLESVCMERGGSLCVVTSTQRWSPVKTWEAVLFSLSMCVLLGCAAPAIDRAWRLAFPKTAQVVQYDTEHTLGNLNSDFENTGNLASFEVPKTNIIRTDVNPLDSSTISFDQRTKIPKKPLSISTTKKEGIPTTFKTRSSRK